jgi:hypothetical protein
MIDLIRFRFKTLNVLVNECGYKAAIRGEQADTFNTCTRLFHEGDGGPYDAAALFMQVQLNQAVSANPAPDSDEGRFALEIAEKIRATLPKCRDAASVETNLARAMRKWTALTDPAGEG